MRKFESTFDAQTPLGTQNFSKFLKISQNLSKSQIPRTRFSQIVSLEMGPPLPPLAKPPLPSDGTKTGADNFDPFDNIVRNGALKQH